MLLGELRVSVLQNPALVLEFFPHSTLSGIHGPGVSYNPYMRPTTQKISWQRLAKCLKSERSAIYLLEYAPFNLKICIWASIPCMTCCINSTMKNHLECFKLSCYFSEFRVKILVKGFGETRYYRWLQSFPWPFLLSRLVFENSLSNFGSPTLDNTHLNLLQSDSHLNLDRE